MKLKLLFLALVVVGLTGCQTQTQEERPQPVESVQQAELTQMEGGGQSGSNQLIGLEELRRNPNLTEIAAPQGFTPTMQGIWTYEDVYVFQINGTSELIEAYTFDGPINQAPAAAICDSKLKSDGSCVRYGTQCFKEGNIIICCA